jgi:leucyl aminopeptidase
VSSITDAPAESGADTICVGLFDGENVAHDVSGGTLQQLVDAGEARRDFRRLAVAHADGKRWILVGLGDRAAFTAERARVAAAVALGRAKELGTRVLCWELPHKIDEAQAAAFVEGTVIGAYEFRAYKSAPDGDDTRRVEELVVSAHHDVSDVVATAAVVAEAVNAARDLQNTPGNDMTPARLAERARELEGVEVDVWGREQIEGAGMGAFAGVAQGSHVDPALITIRYTPAEARGPVLGLVGKAVTFDTGGISIKPGQKMSAMKFDMSGGAAVIEAVGAIARLGLPVRVVAVIGATENMPSGHAMKPGDILRARTGTTIEVINTDAEGRLVLCDCLAHAIEQGAERLVDLATLTGGIVTTFGSVHAGVMSNDDAWCEAVTSAGERTGERLWRLPLDVEYAEMIKGSYGDIVNAVENRKAHSITAAEFLHRFVGDTPWAHLDIAGVADDNGRAYSPTGGSGFGVRLLVDLARTVATS